MLQELQISDQLIRDYLLDRLSPSARARLEDLYFVDDDIFGQVLTAEDRLIGQWHDGQLSGPDRELFQRRYTATPELRDRIRVAGMLAAVACKPISSAVPFVLVSSRSASPMQLLWSGTLAAALLFGVGIVGLRQDRPVSVTDSGPGSHPTTAPDSIPLLQVVDLGGEATSRSVQSNKTLRLTGGSMTISFEASVPGVKSGSAWTVSVSPVDDGLTWSGFATVSQEGVLHFEVPRSALGPNDYLVILDAVTPAAGHATRTFRISN